MTSGRVYVAIGAVSGALAVVAGAFAAHGLADVVGQRQLEVFRTGASYHLIHSLALVFAGLWCQSDGRSRAAAVAAWCFVAGIVLFSGSLYALALDGPRWLGPITPIGGTAFIVGWLGLAISALKR